MALTAKQSRFVEEYLIDLNATQAAIRAGYSAKTAGAVGFENLKKPEIAEAIATKRGELSTRTEVTVDRIVTELARIGFYDPADYAAITHVSGPIDIPSLPEHVRRAIVGWEWDKNGNFTLKLGDKLSALDKLGKHLGMFTDKVEHSGAVNIVIDGDDAKL